LTSELGDSGSPTFHVRLTLLVYQPLFPSVPTTVEPMLGADGSKMLYVSDETAVRPRPSVYEQDAVCCPIPSEAYGPVTALSVAANEEFPSSASVT